MYGCLPLLLFGVFIAVFSLLGTVLRVLFTLKRSAQHFADSVRRGDKPQFTSRREQPKKDAKSRDKHFDRTEGEYVPFEEVKD